MKILFLLLFLPLGLVAQQVAKKDVLKAKRITSNAITLFNEGQSSNAYMLLKQAVAIDSSNANAYYWLATTEFDLRSYHYAKEHSQKSLALQGSESSTDQLYLAAQIDLALNDIQGAKGHIEKAKAKIKSEKDFKLLGFEELRLQCEFVLVALEKGQTNERQLLGDQLNTNYDEYSPILSADGHTLYYTTRNPDAKGANLNPDDQRFFEDINHFEWDTQTNVWTLAPKAIEGINTEGFDALNYISRDGKYALGTINTSASKEKTTKSSEIFEVSSDEAFLFEKVVVLKNKNINTSYFDGSASISDTIFSENGDFSQFLYFVSDRKAEESMTDIYCIEKKNGVWMEMKPLLKTINTDGRETTPFITPNGRFLFFSSDALPGMGGYDVYYSENVNGVWGNPVNLGATFNSVNDDTHFQIYPWLKKAVIARINENEGLFNYDIFQIDLNDLDFPFLKD